MGTFRRGVLGGFTGKIGAVIGSSWRGEDVMRALPRKKKKATATHAQLVQRTKFSVVAKFLFNIKPLLRLYFGQPQGKQSRYNLAMSYFLTEVVTGTYPDYEIDFEQALFSHGHLPGSEEPAAIANAGAMEFSWIDNSDPPLAPDTVLDDYPAQATDLFLVVAYNADKEKFRNRRSATRADGTFLMPLPTSWAGDTVHYWISFVSADGISVSDSEYMGVLVV